MVCKRSSRNIEGDGGQREILHKVRLKRAVSWTWWLGLLAIIWSAHLLAVVQCNQYPNRPPRFLIDGHSEIVLRLKEGPETPVGSLIYRLRGSDPDNDPLTFGIRNTGYGSDVLRIENIGNSEANLYLAQELDREVSSDAHFRPLGELHVLCLSVIFADKR